MEGEKGDVPVLLATGDRQITQLDPRGVLKLTDLLATQGTDGSEAGWSSLQEVKNLVDSNFFNTDLTLLTSRTHNLAGQSLNLQYNNGNLMQLQPSAFQFWKTGAAEGGVNVFSLNYHTVNGISLITGKMTDHANISYYLKTAVIVSTSLKDSVMMGSHVPTTDNATIPAPPIDPEKTVIISAAQDATDKGLATLYAKRVYFDTEILNINPARMPTGAGRVLTDKLGNGVLSLEPGASGGDLILKKYTSVDELTAIPNPEEGLMVYLLDESDSCYLYIYCGSRWRQHIMQ